MLRFTYTPKSTPRRSRWWPVLLALVCAGATSAQLIGRENVIRGMHTARYEIAVQKSATIDVRLANGLAVFEDAWCAVKLAHESQPRKLKLDGRTGQRDMASSKLGQGKTLLLGSDRFLYAINTYETQPFFTIRMGYANDTKKPVTVERLIILAGKGGKDAGLLVGKDPLEARILTGGGVEPCDPAQVLSGTAESRGTVAIWNFASQRGVMAGFLGTPLDAGRFSIAYTGDANEEVGGTFSFEWVPESPVTLEPNASLEIPPLYIAVAETNPMEGLRRYGKALGLMSAASDATANAPNPCAVPLEARDGTASQDCYTDAARRFFLPPSLRNTYDCLDTRVEFRTMQRTILALLNESRIEMGQSGSLLAATPYHPGIGDTAFPLDVFDPVAPSVWSVPITTDAGTWQIYALFNWNKDAAETKRVTVPEGYHTVFDFWEKQYLGTAVDHLEVQVPPNSVRLLCLRPYVDEPMIIGASHIGNGSRELLSVAYDPATRTLRGISNDSAHYYVLVPEGFMLEGGTREWPRRAQEGRIVVVESGGTQAPHDWSVTFSATSASP